MSASLLEELTVARTLHRYCRALDDARYDAVVSLFTTDCVFETMGQVLEGRAAVRAFFPEAPPAPSIRPAVQHVLTNVLVEIDGNEASAESDWVMIDRADGGDCRIALAGRYRDRLRRVDDTWLIAHRIAVALRRSGADQR
jgi:ketosteroid isomerase-like protein